MGVLIFRLADTFGIEYLFWNEHCDQQSEKGNAKSCEVTKAATRVEVGMDVQDKQDL
jgi:hypothetical protein